MNKVPYSQLTIRDWFAGQALSTLLAESGGSTTAARRKANYENYAIQAYAMADAMMKVREQEADSGE